MRSHLREDKEAMETYLELIKGQKTFCRYMVFDQITSLIETKNS